VAAAETAVAASILLMFITACGGSKTAVDATAAYKAKEYPRAAMLFAQVARDEKTPGALYNYGTALIAAESLPPAAEILDRAAERADSEVRYRARFNSGYSHLVRGLVPGPAALSDSAGSEREQALASYKKVLIQRPNDLDAKWNYELALRTQKGGGGGGGGGQSDASKSPAEMKPKPQPTLAQRQAEQLLGSAEREEREVQSKKQQQNRPEPPPGGKDW
jgi:tetratricopeptide (TPR) repeat protein